MSEGACMRNAKLINAATLMLHYDFLCVSL